jgi:hypothetical protein
MKYKIDKDTIKANIDLLATTTEIDLKEAPTENLYIINTPKGKVKVKSTLDYNDFVKALKNNKIQ